MSRIAYSTAIVLATLVGAAMIWQMRSAIVLFVFSLMVAAATRPAVDSLVRRGIPRSLALFVVFASGVAVAAAVVAATVNFVAGDLRRLADDFARLPEHIARNETSGAWIQKSWTLRMPHADEVIKYLGSGEAADAFKMLLGTAFSIVETSIDLVLVIVLSVYWTIDRVHFERLWLSLLPLHERTFGRNTWRAIEIELSSYLRSEVLQSLIAGLVLGIAYYFLGFSYPALMAFAAAVFWLIPWAGIVFTMATLAVLSTPMVLMDGSGHSLMTPLLAGALTAMVFFLLESVVEPRVFNRRRYNSLIIAVAVIAAAETFGVWGLVLGPFLAIAIQVAGECFRQARPDPIDEPTGKARLLDLEARISTVRDQTAMGHEAGPQVRNLIERLAALVRESHAGFIQGASDSSGVKRD